MTSYRHPDYDVGLDLALSNFRSIAGTAFDVTVVFSKIKRRFPSMMIIPEGNNFPDLSSIATAWLWSENCPDMPEGTTVKITVGEPCDPMLTPEEQTSLAAHNGLSIKGVVTRNRNTEKLQEQQ